MPACHNCGHTLNPSTEYGRQDTCSRCGAHTRTCMNCLHYEASRYNECTEPIAERIVDKEKGNFCDYFKPGDRKNSATDARSQALKAAEALFKKGNKE